MYVCSLSALTGNNAYRINFILMSFLITLLLGLCDYGQTYVSISFDANFCFIMINNIISIMKYCDRFFFMNFVCVCSEER